MALVCIHGGECDGCMACQSYNEDFGYDWQRENGYDAFGEMEEIFGEIVRAGR